MKQVKLLRGPFHPAFGQLVESGIWYDVIVQKIKKLNTKVKEVIITVNPQDINNVIGQRRENISNLKEVYDVGETYSKWYYAGADGALVKGWKQIGGKWYYFFGTQKTDKDWDDPYMMTGIWDTYDEAKDEWVSWFDNGIYYGFKDSGEMIVGWGQLGKPGTDGTWVYGNSDGSLLRKTWKKIGGKWYYFGWWGNMFRNGRRYTYDENDKNLYLFDKSGALVENGWFRESWKDESGAVEYGDWFYGGKDGVVQKGWLKDKGNWYYLDAEDGWMWTGWAPMDDGKMYYLDETTGAMVTGWKQIGDIWHFFKDSGAMAVKEWVQSGSAWYYLKEDGWMAKDEILTIDGKPYRFDANGVWVP